MYFAFMDHFTLWLIPTGLFGFGIAVWNYVDLEMDGEPFSSPSLLLRLTPLSGQQPHHPDLQHLPHRLGYSLWAILETNK
jgi:hypothetical protein